jgi:hypothetical protein
MSVGSNSRWNRSAIINVRDRYGRLTRRPFLDILPRYEEIFRQDNRAYRARSSDMWDMLAHKLYGNPDLWPVIAEFNQVINPFDELSPGREVTLPSANAVFLDWLDFPVSTEQDIDVDDEASNS